MLRRIYEFKRKQQQQDRENYILANFIISVYNLIWERLRQ
jgi:hypothetical protein